MVGNDAETNVLTAHQLDKVSLRKGEVVILDGDVVAVREVGLSANAEVADNHPSGASRASGGIRRQGVVEVDGKVYFGEMTFFHCSGMEAFHPEEWDEKFGDWVILPEKNGEESR